MMDSHSAAYISPFRRFGHGVFYFSANDDESNWKK
jgi:hypothetical protein